MSGNSWRASRGSILEHLLDCFGVSCKVSCWLSSIPRCLAALGRFREYLRIPSRYVTVLLHTIAQCCDGSRSRKTCGVLWKKHPRFTWMLTQTARSTFPWDDWDDRLEKDSCSALEYMGMDQYLLIPFLGEWTSINPSYFDVNRRGTIGFDTLPYWNILGILKNLTETHRTPSALWRHRHVSRSGFAEPRSSEYHGSQHSQAQIPSALPAYRLLTHY